MDHVKNRTPDGYHFPLDCNDGDAKVNPGVNERCNGIDDDCDGVSDEVDAADARMWYTDVDGDGAGDPSSAQKSCVVLEGLVAVGGDCGAADPAIHPQAIERCNEKDDNCDGTVDEADAADAKIWYIDADLDGFGLTAVQKLACAKLERYAAKGDDCDDTSRLANPAATESCNSSDDDCDGKVDEGSWYRDADSDGFGGAKVACTAGGIPAVTNAWDCDDRTGSVAPGQPERCNKVDDDCDGTIDVGCPR